MFTYALRSKILVRVSLGEFGSHYNLHYADDLLVMTTSGLEDLRIVKLILYLFEGMTCLYSSRMSELPHVFWLLLNCEVGYLLVTYLGVLVIGRQPRRQDYEGMIQKVRMRLSSWKV